MLERFKKSDRELGAFAAAAPVLDQCYAQNINLTVRRISMSLAFYCKMFLVSYRYTQ